jgi:tetratricopeptide (TPR) repeat protein
MAEQAIRSNEREAARLFQRGVAAARGGQRRVAAGLLARCVQLNPRHELGWLWLSGVLDDPDEIAFCLRSVLSVNPHNERARQGLAWLEQHALIASQPSPSAVIEAPVDEHVEEQQARHEGESWWVNWRRSRRDMSRVRLVFWSIPILLLALTLGLNLMLRQAIERNAALAHAAVPTPAPPRPVVAPIIEAEPAPVRDAQVLAYLSALEAPRAQLRAAVQAYKDATGQPGGSSVVHAAAARRLREQVEAAYDSIAGLTPPPTLAQAHADYLAGIELELAALDDMLEFYNSFQIQIANRATLRFEDAGKQLERARARFDEYRVRALNRALQQQMVR